MTLFDFKKKILPHLIRFGIGLGIGIIVVLLTQGYFFNIRFLENIEYLTIDYRYYQRQALKDVGTSGDVVIIEISDKDLEAMPDKFPFPRSYYAHLIENLNRAGVKAIGFDMTFESKGAGDSVMANVLRKYNNIVLATKAAPPSTDERYAKVISTGYNNVFENVQQRFGIVNILKDRDDVVRRYTPMFSISEAVQRPTFAFALASLVLNMPPTATAGISSDAFILKDRKIPKYDDQTFLINYYGPVRTFPYISFTNVIDDETFETKEEIDLEHTPVNYFDQTTMDFLKGKIVIIGSTMPEERDDHPTPMPNLTDPQQSTRMYGVEIHATVLQNILDNWFITKADEGAEIALIILLAIISFLGIYHFKQIKIRHVWILEIAAFLLVGLLIFGVFEYSVFMFSNNGLLANIINPSIAILLAYVGTIVYQYLTERQQKALIKNVFSHYINPTVVNELVANPEKAKLGGDRRELTVFFSDIAGFTSISETLSPEKLVELINEYLEEMTKIIFQLEGTLDKYEGDAIMAFWGAPIPQKDHALRACLTALEMQKRLQILRAKWKKENKPQLEIRIGINTGMMIVGNMGGQDRFDYTVIGDSVNLSSRLEGANKQYQSKIMISEFTYNHVRNKVIVRELDLIQVKGKSEPVKVYELLGTIKTIFTENEKQALELYHEGLKLYRSKNWEESIAYMQQAYNLDPTCYASQIYIQRANLYQISPPPVDWNGVFVMMTK